MDEDIKTVEEYIEYKKSDVSEYSDEKEMKAIENLLSRLKTAESEIEVSNQLIERQDLEIDNLKEKLKTAERMIELMAEFMNKRSWKEHQVKDEVCCCCKIEFGSDECKQCIKEWARKKVEDE